MGQAASAYRHGRSRLPTGVLPVARSSALAEQRSHSWIMARNSLDFRDNVLPILEARGIRQPG
jgi:hypothetical protein